MKCDIHVVVKENHLVEHQLPVSTVFLFKVIYLRHFAVPALMLLMTLSLFLSMPSIRNFVAMLLKQNRKF